MGYVLAWAYVAGAFVLAIVITVIMARNAARMTKPARETMKHYAKGDYTYSFFAEERAKKSARAKR